MKNLFTSLFLLFCFFKVEASHVIGGTLTYRCLGNGQFRFTLVMYRDCVGAPWNEDSVRLQGPVSGTLTLVGSQDISPRCETATNFNCSPTGGASGVLGTTSKFTYSGIVNLSNLGPAPLNRGYTFFVTFPCCRVSLGNMLGLELGLQVKMFRYTHPLTGQVLSPAQLCDNSPEFISDPTTALVYSESDTVRMQNLAGDTDGDLVLHNIDFPMSNFLAPYAYTPPYNVNAPLPGMVGFPAVDPSNSPVHKVLGEVVIRPVTTGRFVYVVRADGFRNGQLVSSVYRDFTLLIMLPPGNIPPLSQGPFQQKPPQMDLPILAGVGGRSSLDWEFYSGDSISLYFNATDIYPSLVGDPSAPSTWAPSNEALRYAVQGSALSSSNQAVAGCANPPCATIRNELQTTAMPSLLNFGNGQFMGSGYQFGTQGIISFRWVPSCGNLPPRPDTTLNLLQNYGFMLRTSDNQCIIQGRSDRAMVIKVRSKPLIPGPDFTSLQFDTVNRRYRLQWTSQLDTINADSVDIRNWTGLLTPQQILAKSVARRRDSFTSFRVYRSINGGPWQLATSLPPLSSILWIDTLRFSSSHDVAYQVRSVSGCSSAELGSQVLSNSFFSTSVLEQDEGRFTLSPNPGQAWYTISAEGVALPKILELRDVQGRIIKLLHTQEEARLEFDISELPAGMYLLQNAEGNVRLKLMHRP
ncbi:MAG: hypothetical protein C0424_05800 [Sphingobacteriaceae bacterium]|nr:hypothetical protein [Sphingobacteriaceae bacterium]